MLKTRSLIALILTFSTLTFATAAEKQANSYQIQYDGGSAQNFKTGNWLKLFIEKDRIRIESDNKKQEPLIVPASAITEISYGQDVHRRIGTAVGLAVVSLGIGALMALSKSKKHYVGLTWANGEEKGGIAFQADKNDYRGVLAGLEGITGKKAVDSDTLTVKN